MAAASAFLLLLSGFGVLFVGGTLVPASANVNHWTAAFPSFYAALALPVAGLAWASGRVLSHRRQYVGVGLLAAALIVLGWLNIHYYFADYQMYRPEFDIPAAKARFQAQLGPDYRVRSVSRTWQGYDIGLTSYLVKGIDGGQIWNPAAELPMTDVPGKGLAFTFFGDHVQSLQSGWHQVSVEATLDRPAAIKLMLTEGGDAPAEVAREQLWPVEPDSGLLGSVAAADPSVQRIVRYDPFIGFTDLQSGQVMGSQKGAGGPFRVRWTGELLVPEEGSYQLEVVTNGQACLYVGGVGLLKTCAGNDPAAADSTLTLSAGWHPIQLDYQSGGNSNTLELYWRGPDGQRFIIPPSAFRFAPGDQDLQVNAPNTPAIVDCNSL